MRYNSKAIHSDSTSEDRGYDPRHRHTEGGYQAYARGEQPMTYWNKKAILNSIYNRIQDISKQTGSKNKIVIARTLNFAEKRVSDYIAELNKPTHAQLKDKFLQYTGIHYTGSHYRYTKFYGIISEDSITKDICNTYKPPIPIQLLLLDIKE